MPKSRLRKLGELGRLMLHLARRRTNQLSNRYNGRDALLQQDLRAAMSGDRQAFLDRVRRAVAAGNRAGDATPLPERDGVGYQGAGADAVGRFAAELAAAGGAAHVVADTEAAAAQVMALLHERGARRVVLGRGTVVDRL